MKDEQFQLTERKSNSHDGYELSSISMSVKSNEIAFVRGASITYSHIRLTPYIFGYIGDVILPVGVEYVPPHTEKYIFIDQIKSNRGFLCMQCRLKDPHVS